MELRREFGEYVARHHPFENLELVDSANLTTEEHGSVPLTWIDVADLDGRAAVEAALAIWEAAVPGRFPGTVADLRDRGLDVFLGRAQISGFDESQIIVVYAIRSNFEWRHFDACFGFLPATPDLLPAFWDRFANGIGRFHTHAHNGFRATFGGILPAHNFRGTQIDTQAIEFEFLGEDLEPLPAERQPNLAELIVVVRDGWWGGCVRHRQSGTARLGGIRTNRAVPAGTVVSVGLLCHVRPQQQLRVANRAGLPEC